MIGLKGVVVSQGLVESLCQSEKLKTDNISIAPYTSASQQHMNSEGTFSGKAR